MDFSYNGATSRTFAGSEVSASKDGATEFRSQNGQPDRAAAPVRSPAASTLNEGDGHLADNSSGRTRRDDPRNATPELRQPARRRRRKDDSAEPRSRRSSRCATTSATSPSWHGSHGAQGGLRLPDRPNYDMSNGHLREPVLRVPPGRELAAAVQGGITATAIPRCSSRQQPVRPLRAGRLDAAKNLTDERRAALGLRNQHDEQRLGDAARHRQGAADCLPALPTSRWAARTTGASGRAVQHQRLHLDRQQSQPVQGDGPAAYRPVGIRPGTRRRC